MLHITTIQDHKVRRWTTSNERRVDRQEEYKELGAQAQRIVVFEKIVLSIALEEGDLFETLRRESSERWKDVCMLI